MSNAQKLYIPWLIFLLAGIAVGLFAAVKLFAQGHSLFNANDVLIWTLPLATYVFLALTSTGLTLVASMPLVFNLEQYEPLAKRLVYLAIATLVGAFLAIGLELGSPLHMIYFLFSPNLTSPIWYLGALYSLELVFLLIKLWRMHRGDWHSTLSRYLGIASMLTGVFAALMLGSVFGLTEARPTYFGPFLSVFCLVIALLSGMAGIILYLNVCKWARGTCSRVTESAMNQLSRKFSFVIGLTLLFYVLKLALASGTTYPEFATAINFSLILFLLVPYLLMLIPGLRRTGWGLTLASIITLVGIFAVHLQILIGGQVRPMGPKAEGLPNVLPYTPSLWEILVVVFSFCVMFLLYTLGERYLGLEDTPEAEEESTEGLGQSA